MRDHCRICGTSGEMRLLDNAWVCPRCYKALTFEVMRGERKMLEQIARDYDLTPEDVWEVVANEIDFMPEEVGDDDAE